MNWNGKQHIERCLSSLEKMNYPCDRYEVLFVDNCSTDGSVDFVKTKFPWVNVVIFEKNYGFAEANNLSLKYTVGDYLVFLNNDTEVTVDWLLKLVNASKTHMSPICCSKTLFLSNPEIVHYSGAKFVINGRGSSTAFFRKNSSILNTDFYTGYPCATSMLIKRDIFVKLGGFDPDYFACLDDTDLGWRAWLLGYSVLCCPSSVVYHAVGGTTGMARMSSMRAFQGTKNALMNILKNLEFKNIAKGIAVAIVYDYIEFLLLLKRKDNRYAINKVKGYLWVLKNLRKIIRKRRVIQKKRRVSDKWLCDNGFMSSLSEAIHEYLRLSKLDSNNLWGAPRSEFQALDKHHLGNKN